MAAGQGCREPRLDCWVHAALQRRNQQQGQEQVLQSNSKKTPKTSIDSTLTLRERAGRRECPSSVGFYNTLHFPSSAPSVQNSDYSKHAHPTCWEVLGKLQCRLPAPAHCPCQWAQTYSHASTSGTHSVSPSKTSLTWELWITSCRDGSPLPLSSTEQLAELDAKGSVDWFSLQLQLDYTREGLCQLCMCTTEIHHVCVLFLSALTPAPCLSHLEQMCNYTTSVTEAF